MTNRRPPSTPPAPLLPRAPLAPSLPRLPRGGITEVVSDTPRPRHTDERVERAPTPVPPPGSLSSREAVTSLGRPRDDTGGKGSLSGPPRALRLTYPASASREPAAPGESDRAAARFDLPTADELTLGIAMTRARKRALASAAVLCAWGTLAGTVLWRRGDGFDKALMVAVGGLALLVFTGCFVLWREARLEYLSARALRVQRAQWVTSALSALTEHSRRS